MSTYLYANRIGDDEAKALTEALKTKPIFKISPEINCKIAGLTSEPEVHSEDESYKIACQNFDRPSPK